MKGPEQKPPGLAGWVLRLPKPGSGDNDDSFAVVENREPLNDRVAGIEKTTKEENEKITAEVNNCQVDREEGNNCRSDLPSTGQSPEPEVACQIDKKGSHCQTHNITAKKVLVTAKKWKDRGKGRGFGYTYSKVAKYICQAKKSMGEVSNISDDVEFLRGSVNMNNIATGVDREKTDLGDYSESFESESFKEIDRSRDNRDPGDYKTRL